LRRPCHSLFFRGRRRSRSTPALGDNTPANTPNLRPPWKPGESGNPAGRPKGARNKINEDFLDALQVDFEQHGPTVIARVRQTMPHIYLKVVASLLPKEFTGPDGAPLIPDSAPVIILEVDGPATVKTESRVRKPIAPQSH
jgi:hypothetical protein